MSGQVAHLRRLLEYDQWANVATLGSIAAAGKPAPKALHLMSHIIAAEQLWINRIRASGVRVVVWPELSIAECGTQLNQLPELWREVLDAPRDAGPQVSVSYTNTKGEPWASTVEDIILHIVTHSAYHRGQIAAELRRSGERPAYTDFIHCVRQGLLA
jgi:uncharacterized damage-inducible protein DinB